MWLYTLPLSSRPVSLLLRPCLPLPVTMPSGWLRWGLGAAGGGLAHLCVSGCSWPHRSCPRSRGNHHRRSPGGGRAPGRTSAHPRHSSLQRGQRWPGWQWHRTGHPSLPQCPGRYGRPPGTTCSEEAWQCPGVGVLTLTGSYGTVAGTEAWGAHAAVRNEGDTQAVGVGVEGWGGHAATKPVGTTKGQCLPPEILPSPHRTATLPGYKEPYLVGPLRTGAGSVLLAPCSS